MEKINVNELKEMSIEQAIETVKQEDNTISKLTLTPETEDTNKEIESTTEYTKSSQSLSLPTIEWVEKRNIPNIIDKNGEISNYINSLEIENNTPVLSFSIIGLNENVIELYSHDIVELGDEKYAMSVVKTSDNPQYLKDIIGEIEDKLKRGTIANINLWKEVEIEGKHYLLPKVTLYDISLIQTLFSDYNPKLTYDKAESKLSIQFSVIKFK